MDCRMPLFGQNNQLKNVDKLLLRTLFQHEKPHKNVSIFKFSEITYFMGNYDSKCARTRARNCFKE